MKKLFNSLSVVTFGGYLLVVTINGNIGQLFTEARRDYGYLEFLVALLLLKVIADNPETHDVVVMLIFGGILAGVLKTIGTSGNRQSEILRRFGAGEIGLFEAFKAMFFTDTSLSRLYGKE